jgi:hypothetical protein
VSREVAPQLEIIIYQLLQNVFFHNWGRLDVAVRLGPGPN